MSCLHVFGRHDKKKGGQNIKNRDWILAPAGTWFLKILAS
jgi:hypothetical protein